MPKPSSSPVVFQDVLAEHLQKNDESQSMDEAVSLAFFGWANASEIAFRIDDESQLTLHQDISACGQHTGGIVWETSVLLLNYLLATNVELKKKRVVEVGAGCGLLGIGLAAIKNPPRQVILAETSQVLKNIQRNLAKNRPLVENCAVRACALDWTRLREDAAASDITRGCADVVLGTDVLFSPALVDPLLETLDFLLADKKKATIYICVQVRCAASHEKFFRMAAERFFVDEVSPDDLKAIPECEWGPATGCQLFLLSRRSKKHAREEASEKSKKKKR